MATTGTYVYDIIAADMITEALKTLGVIEEGGTATPVQITDALPSFEMYIKSLSKYGLNLWTVLNESETIALVESTASYSLGTTPATKALKITDMVFRDSTGQDTIMIPLTREEYWNLNDKDQESQPTQFFFDPNSQADSTIYVWPVPDATSATGTLQVVYQHYLQDVDTAADGTAPSNVDVPQEWLETIKYGLSTRLAPMNGYPVQERNLLLKEYKEMLKENLDWDTEQESIFLRPDYDRQIA